MSEPKKIVSTKTKKKRSKKGKNKKELWSLFDSEFGGKSSENPDIECIYTKNNDSGEHSVMLREVCDACGEKIT